MCARRQSRSDMLKRASTCTYSKRSQIRPWYAEGTRLFAIRALAQCNDVSARTWAVISPPFARRRCFSRCAGYREHEDMQLGLHEVTAFCNEPQLPRSGQGAPDDAFPFGVQRLRFGWPCAFLFLKRGFQF